MISQESSKIKYVFFDNVKTGSSTIRTILMNNFRDTVDLNTKHTKIVSKNYKFIREDGDSKLVLTKDDLDWCMKEVDIAKEVLKEKINQSGATWRLANQSLPLRRKLKNALSKDFKKIRFIDQDEFTNEYFNVATIRNPFDRLFSCFRHRLHKATCRCLELNRNDYESWLIKNAEGGISESVNTCSLLTNISLPNSTDLSHIDFFIRFENYVRDVKACFDTLGLSISSIKMPHEKKTRALNYRPFYTDTAKQIVFEKYKNELDAFNYDF